MEPQFRPGFDRTQGYSPGSPPVKSVGYILLRVVAVVLTLISTVVMGGAREIVVLLIRDPTTNETSTLTATVKSTYSAGYVYFVIVNSMVFFYSVISLAISMAKKGTVFALAVADLVALVLLFSGNGAATAISVVAENGQHNLAGWDRICDTVSKFCTRINAAIVMSILASMAYFLLVLVGMIGLKKRSY